MDSDSASVVLPSLSVARNVYHTFDEELYQRTVDEILSDETSFDTSFDEYSGYQTMDGSADARSREKDEYAAASWKGSWHTKKSPYFSTASPASSSFASALKPKKSVKKPSAMTKRYITKVETTDDDEAEDRSFLLTKKNPSASALTISDPALAFAYDHEYMKNVVEEDIVFGSVDPDKRDQLLQFIAAHSFMRKHKYPVKRSTRRKFIQDLNREATSSGLDQATLDRLRQHVKKTYLELFGTNAVYREGSEFGDEIDGTSKRKAKFEKCKESPKDKQPNIKEMTKSLAKNMKNVSDLAMPKPDNELSSASKGKGKSKLLEPRNALKRKQGNDQEPRKKSRNLHGNECKAPERKRNGFFQSHSVGFLTANDSPSSTTSDEANSKYFIDSSGIKSIKLPNKAVVRDDNATDDFTLPSTPGASNITGQTGLSNFSSDSTLTDVVNSEAFRNTKNPEKIAESLGYKVSQFDHKSLHTKAHTPPPLGISSSRPAATAQKRSRLTFPKISPYFPEPLVDPNSCLPFPPIDVPSFGLVQEQLAHDPFRLLLATIFLNRTRGGVALPVLFQVFDRFPTIEDMAAANPPELVSMIHCLGFQNQRAKKCITLAQTWLARTPACGKRYRKLNYPNKYDGRDVKPGECIGDNDPRVAWEIGHLPGVGAYSLDSWRIFCRDELRGLAKDWKAGGATTAAESAGFVPEWKSVLPQDKELRAYLTWMWLKEGWIWDRHTGERTRASEKMMRAARRGAIAHIEEGNWVLETSPVKRAI
ncbi:hypothetical protein AOCH_004257 [Aspergillus ochraceoroseus]|uniref:HhH-GPD domain-containing protein n=1 Tax=Aspergillus ochraceoroseus TaxID=138278 RepID=A0A0F8WVF4_9EURO|nr:hypothetical protein AOCH_004257 [Aspergillus ochraceoroseus]